MAFISFALTKNEFLSGIKKQTRRDWKLSHTINWQKWYNEGKIIHDAWDKVPFAGGKKIGQFKLTRQPYLQPIHEMTALDLYEEGNMCKNIAEYCALVKLPAGHIVTVIHFVKIIICECGDHIKDGDYHIHKDGKNYCEMCAEGSEE